MTAPGQSPWDGNPLATPPVAVAYRPGTDDFNGAALADDPANPPNPQTMPTGPLFNTYSKTIVSLGQVAPNLVVNIAGGVTPAFVSQTACGSNVPHPSILRNGPGDVSLTWPAGALPAPVAGPRAYLRSGPGSIYAVAITNGVRVHTHNISGGAFAAADLDFGVDVL
jgi:hypothetical protein